MPAFMDSDGKKKGKRGARNIELGRASAFETSLLTAERILPILELVMAEGGALRFGLTQDKGALALGIYGLGDPQTKYVRSEEELDALLEAVYHAFKGDLD